MTADETKNNVTGDAAADAAAEGAAEKAAEAPQADKAAEADKPAKPKRARAAKPKVAKADAGEKADTADAEADKPAKPKRARAAKPKAAKAAEAEAAEKAEETEAAAKPEAAEKADKPAKPKRARAAKPKAAKAAEAEAAEAEKPAKPRRRGKAAAPVAPARAERPPKPEKAKAAPHEPRRGAAGKASVVDAAGKDVEARDLRPDLFAVPADVGVMHLAVRGEQLARRRGTASTKTRGEISGTTAKLFRQKGTGRARAGSIKSPVRTGGGTAFGPKPRSYAIKVNRKVVKKALAMALSNRAENGHVFVAAGLDLEAPSTRRMNEFLVGLDIAAPVLVVTHDEPVVAKSVRNLSYAETVEVRGLSTERVLRTRSLLLTEKAFAALNEA